MAGTLTLLLAIALLLFMFKHRLVPFRLKSSQKQILQQRKPMPITDKPPMPQAIIPTSAHPYHSVEIVDDTGRCKNALSLKGKRFLSLEAPSLPLFGCKNSECHCYYVHHEDRRNENRGRRIDYGVTHELYGVFGEENRRGFRNGGRRFTDNG